MPLCTKTLAKSLLSGLVLLGVAACGPDLDGDGVGGNQDCNDENPNVNPNAQEVCDFVDNDCDGQTDEGFDQDQDVFSVCGGDCNDLDANVNPNENEPPGDDPDGIDNDCDGVIDPPPLLPPDQDQDGFGIDVDCNDQNVSINPGAIEVQGNTIDDDCNGQIDEALVPCDGNLNAADPFSFPKAIGLCHGEVREITFTGPSNPQSRAISGAFGPNQPLEGSRQILLSTGRADTGSHDPGTDFGNSFANPDLTATQGCGAGDPPNTVFDYTEIQLKIKVPTNAFGFSYQFQFFSSEYPTFHCSAFNDSFVALLDSNAFPNTNVSFDANGDVVSVNNGFFQVCTINDQGNNCLTNPDPQTIVDGTGFNLNNNDFLASSIGAGATLPLVTTVPTVEPGEEITLRFIISDQGDGNLDSTVRIDNFVWLAVGCDPLTDPNQCRPTTKIP
jgi:Putative metal-binding motif